MGEVVATAGASSYAGPATRGNMRYTFSGDAFAPLVIAVNPARRLGIFITMTEVWLQPNRRALWTTLLTFAAIGVVALVASASFEGMLLRIVSGIVALLALLLVGASTVELRRPRIAYQDGHVLFNLRGSAPAAVPAEVVEAFFLGQGPAHLPTIRTQPPECVNLIARLSEKAPEFAKVEVKPALGAWCEGYVTIRGAWCEPLTNEVIRRLNRRLRELRELRDAAAATPQGEPS